MRINIEIDGVRRVYDLTRVHNFDDIGSGEKVVTVHPHTHNLCIAITSFDYYGHLWLTDTVRELAPYRWRVGKKDVWSKVYKINK